MEQYMILDSKLAKKQVIERITLELVYEFLILESKEMNIVKVDNLSVFSDTEYMSFIDTAIDNLNQKLKVKLVRKNNKIHLGNWNR